MRYLRTYENINEPKTGDYVICKGNTGSSLDKFLDDNLGIFIGPTYTGSNQELIKKLGNKYKVLYQNVPWYLAMSYFTKKLDVANNNNVRSFDKSQIRKATPEEIEKYKIKIAENKYNI